jgi:hypothetical protein
VLGFPLWPKQAQILDEIYRDQIRTAVLRLGRRSGKDRMAAVIATFEATVNAGAHLAAVPAGEQISIVVVATSQRQARVCHRYIRGFLTSPALAPLVVRDTEDEIELANGISIVTVPCSARSARGQAVAVLVMDEAAWMLDTEGSAIAAEEVWSALAPATAQFPQGRCLVLSTPRWAGGWFAEMCTQAASGDYSDMRHWHATTAEMNEAIRSSFLAGEQSKDPAAFRREYLAEFDSGIGAVFDSDLVHAAVVRRGPLSAVPGTAYVIALDPAFTGDTWSAIVGHKEDSGRIVVDRIEAWRGSRAKPVQIDQTLDEVAALAGGYNRAAIVTDQYSAEPIRQGLVKRGLEVRAKPWTNELKSDAVGAVRQCLYSGRLEIPEHRGLIEELVTLEQRPLPSGRPHIAAPGRAHDDFATALMALVLDVADPPEPGWIGFFREKAAALEQETPRSVLPDGSPLPVCGLRFRKPDGSIAVCAMPQMHPAGGHAEAQAAPECPAGGTVLPDAPPCAELYRTETGGIDACALPKGHAGRHGPGAALRESPAFPGLPAAMWGGH